MSAFKDSIVREYKTAGIKIKLWQKHYARLYRAGLVNTEEGIMIRDKIYGLSLERKRLKKIFNRIY